ncbi:MAG TPA: polysaccharide biosynthesis tyrosine autokinase [Bacteroidia bacterium]
MASAKNKASFVEMGDLKSIWKIVAKNWYIVLLLAAFSYSVGLFYSFRLTDVYAARTQILLKSFDEYQPNSIISDNEGSVSSTYKSYVDNSNQMRVIKSYDLIEKSIRRMKLDVSYFIQGRVRLTEIYEGTPFEVNVLKINPVFYEKDFRFRVLDTQHFELSYSKGDSAIVLKCDFDKELVNPDFRILVRKAGEINRQTVKSLSFINYIFKIHSLSTLVYRCMSAMDVENPDYTNVLQVTLEDPIPKRAEELLDTIAHVYIENTLQQRFDINRNTLVYINRQMDTVVDILNNIEDTLQLYKEKHGILDLSREEQDYFDKLSGYDRQKSNYQLNISALDALEDYVIQNKDPEFLPPNIYVDINDNFLLKNVSDLYNMQIERNAGLTSATNKNLAIQGIDKKIELSKKDILVYIGNSRIAIQSRIKDLEDEMNKYIANIQTIPEKQRGLMNIQRRQKVNEDLYIFLLQKRANTVIAKAGIIPLTKVIETSRSMGLVKPNRTRIILGFVGVGLLISFIIVFIRVAFYDKIESVDELKQKTELPIVGEILHNRMMKELTIPVETDPKSPISESFRTIRTNLQYLAPDSKGAKVIVITSNNPGEGKTFCSINLASIFSKAGKKVLLLELDLHKPRVQKGLNITSDKGISTILIGKDDIASCVKNTQIENLDAILSGPIPPNASELLLSDNMRRIFEFGRQHYDYVVVDTPPVGLISDALVLMQLADISLFVLNTKFAFREAIANAHEIVNVNKLVNFAFILNGVKRKKSKYYYNRYAYGYGYGGRYGYGYGAYKAYGGHGYGYGNNGYGDPPTQEKKS